MGLRVDPGAPNSPKGRSFGVWGFKGLELIFGAPNSTKGRSYLQTFDPKVGAIRMLGAPGSLHETAQGPPNRKRAKLGVGVISISMSL